MVSHIYYIYIYMRIKYFAYGCVLFLRGLKYTPPPSGLTNSARTSKCSKGPRDPSASNGIGRREWKTPVIYIHFGMRFTIIIIIYYIVYTVVVGGSGGAVQQHREMYSLSTYKYPRIPPRLPSSKQRRFLFHLFIFTNWSRCFGKW